MVEITAARDPEEHLRMEYFVRYVRQDLPAISAEQDGRPLTADATEPAWNGYLLTVACSCGVVFERWVTPEEADADLLGLASSN
jgi:hypothetical protein